MGIVSIIHNPLSQFPFHNYSFSLDDLGNFCHTGIMPEHSLPSHKTTEPSPQPSSESFAARSNNLSQPAWIGYVGNVFTKIFGWLSKAWSVAAYAIGSFVLVVIGLIVLTVWLSGNASGQVSNEVYVSGSGMDKIAIIDLQGIVGGSTGGVLEAPSGISTETVRTSLDQADNDSLVKAVILRINTPGGSAVVSDEIFELIKAFKAGANKPVVASFGDIAASGGYYIGAAADKIVANPATITGSIGVIMEYYNASGLMEKIGVSSEVVKSGSLKDMGSLSREATVEERAILQSVVDGAYTQFVDRVASGRGMERQAVLNLADGRIYTGSQAKDNGLVDEVGNLDKAVSMSMDLADIGEATVVRYNSGSWWESLLSTASKLSPWYGVSELTQDYGLKGQLQYLWKL